MEAALLPGSDPPAPPTPYLGKNIKQMPALPSIPGRRECAGALDPEPRALLCCVRWKVLFQARNAVRRRDAS